MCNKDEILKEYRAVYDEENGAFAKLKRMHAESAFKVPDHNKNKSRICFIFSCPGREELIHDQVCCGETGENLNVLLRIMNEYNCELFNSTDRYGYDILNASDTVHFYALDKKTEAGSCEIKKGLQRIYDYIENNNGLTHILMFGKKAESICDVLQQFATGKERNITFIKNIPHLGYQSLNQISGDVDGDPINEGCYDSSKARTEARLKVVAKRIIEQI